jgi:hypothetical protein
MSAYNPRLSPLASRKQLLLAESELNRALLAGEVAALKSGIRAFTERANYFGSIASSAAALGAGLASVIRPKSATAAPPKRSWLRTLFKGGGLLFSLWLELRSRGRNRPAV